MKIIKILTVICALVLTSNVHAALQSRPGVAAKGTTNVSNFFKFIREMEAEGGALGLNATFAENASGAYEETSVSNNIDVHMCKNTEWGAAAMLSASEYGAGKGNVKNDYTSSTKIYGITASTTGNMTGVFGMYAGAVQDEYVAAGVISYMPSEYNKYIINAPTRYVDSYAEGSSSSDFTRYIAGDATYEAKLLFGGSGTFVYSAPGAAVFRRGGKGVFDSSSGDGNIHWYPRFACLRMGGR